MGLDMYLQAERYFFGYGEEEKATDSKETSGKFPVKSKKYEAGYWRKHPNLHGYIVENFAHNAEDNCQPIELSESNLLQIINAVKNKELPTTGGFFFGESSEEDEQIQSDIKILETARKWLLEEETKVWRSIHYRASW